jgi:glycosyltransferase involved in cell wall biosynthesis
LLDEQKGTRNLLKSVLLKWVYKQVDHAFYVGTNNKNYFKKYGLTDNQLSFAPHATDNERFAEDKSADAGLIRKKLGISNDEMLILFAGKLENKKSPALLLNAFSELNNPGMHLLFVGNGDLENELKVLAANNPAIHFMDFQNQSVMPGIYQACDLFCLPSKGPGETWGLAVNEAMACGKAILVSDKVGCAIDLVKEGYNGMIFKSGNLKDLKEKLNELTLSNKLLKEYGNNSKQLIADWSFLKIAEAIENKLDD